MSDSTRPIPARPLRPQRRRGSIVIYAVFLVILMIAMISLAVDFTRLQLIKTEMQRSADAAARGTLQMYVENGLSTAQWVGPMMANNTYNPVEANSGVQPTIVHTWGWWDAASKTFNAGNGLPMAVRVTLSRTVANGNAVRLIFPVMNGMSGVRTTCDVSATAVAVLQPKVTVTQTVPATADLWLSGMPAGSNAGCWDNPSNAAPVLAMNVTPGTVVNFSATGQTMYNGTATNIGAEGSASNVTHMQNSPDGNYNGLQNGIQTLVAPQNALIGVFVGASAPNTQTPPTTSRDYSTAAARDTAGTTDAQTQQPFFIGNGTTSGGKTQSIVVPPGATRLFLGVYDGFYNADNPGSLTVTTTHRARVYLVK